MGQTTEQRATPGPWRVEEPKQRQHYANVIAPNGGLLFSVSKDSCDDTEWIFNAYLAAAAPDLLDVARLVIECRHGRPGYLCPKCVSVLQKEAIYAIDKAEGRAS